jgi:hypothetical protein
MLHYTTRGGILPAMNLPNGLICSLVPVALVQAGALIYFAGVVSATLKSHGERLDKAGL